MSVGKSVGKVLGNPTGQEVGAGPSVPVPSPEGGGTRDGKPILGISQQDAVPSGKDVGKSVGTTLGKNEEHKAKLMANPRFAGWAAGAKA